MLNLKDITLIAATGVKVGETLKALKFSSTHINFKEVKLITNQKVTDSEIECVIDKTIDFSSRKQYSKFIVYDLHKFIKTKFCLIVQWDGFVINSEAWTDEFLSYDYIGAPWPLPTKQNQFRDHIDRISLVGNGGFSLRTKKLLELASKLNLAWKPDRQGLWNEDLWFCCSNKHVYEQHGFKFAPVELAKRFSFELEASEVPTFGFHGRQNIPTTIKKEY
jgi:hypothetical protein